MRVAFFAFKNLKGNPMLRMYLAALAGRYSSVVVSNDFFISSGVKWIPSTYYIFNGFKKGLRRFFVREQAALISQSGCGSVKAKHNPNWFFVILYILILLLNNSVQFFVFILFGGFGRLKSVVAVDADYLFSAWAVSKLYRANFIYSVYEIWPDQRVVLNVRHASYRKAMAIFEGFFCKRANTIVCVQENWVKLIARRYGIERKFFEVVAVCPDRLDEAPVKRAPWEVFSFHYHGGFFFERGLENLVLAFRDIEGANLYLRGSGPAENILRDLVEKYGLNEKVIFLPPVTLEELVLSASKYDVGIVLAMPSSANGRMCTGFKLFEYLNSGLPVLGPSSYPLLRFFRDYKVGINYGWPTTEGFTKVIRWVLANPVVMSDLANNAKAAAAEFNSEVQGSRFLKVIEQ